eukprot:6171110-Amphidinium_carterae.1
MDAALGRMLRSSSSASEFLVRLEDPTLAGTSGELIAVSDDGTGTAYQNPIGLSCFAGHGFVEKSQIEAMSFLSWVATKTEDFVMSADIARADASEARFAGRKYECVPQVKWPKLAAG